MAGIMMTHMAATAQAGAVSEPQAPDITGSLTVGNNGGSMYGYSPGAPQQFIPPHGSLTQDPSGIIRAINYLPDYQETVINLTNGTYTGANGTLEVTEGKLINGSSNLSVKIGEVTQTFTPDGPGIARTLVLGNDPFNLVAQNGQTVAIEITVG